MKIKVGDKVKLIKATDCTYGFEVGDICEILNTNSNGRHQIEIIKNNGCTGYVDEKHIELVNKQFTKSDLKDGDIVTYRNGEKRTVINNKLIDEEGEDANELNYYEKDLIQEDGTSDLDIIKVERPTGYTTVFERKEEILDETEKRYLRVVIRPFRKEICSIKKAGGTTKEHLKIYFKDADYMSFKNFKKDTMYKGMKADKEYTLEELGL